MFEVKRLELFRLRSAEDTATNFYRLDGVTVIRDGNRWAISTGDVVRATDANRGLKAIKKDEQVRMLSMLNWADSCSQED